ncbi:Alpha/beta hydrolase family protein [Lacunisphaera limnophila]|uniref:Alpha/beta hydrolase family protein n=1 Tax=Lacunisphaera limnophila TaxID=1838286 RepID=A0A1D8AR24_9BACT|nr:CocE/NonD family hydrolase [Lacunisphaera limnophila]AOS43332.1 Alpha/beta hydrolase family protein [Lacunisphaera limnophila]
MTISNWFRIGLLVVLTGLVGRAGETFVEIAPEVRGAWVTPEGVWDGRTVLLFHGMASDMDDAGGSLKLLAQGLAERGIASLRINFRGEGDQARTKIESTFITRLEDAAAAHAWLLQQAGVATGRVGAFGFSLGAPTAVVTGARHPGWFKSIAVWSAPSGDLFALWANDETAQRALRDGEATQEIPGWKTLTTKREFYESFRGFNFDEALAKYPGALLAVRGSADYLAHREDELMKILAARPASVLPGSPAEAVLIGGADHIFNVFQPELGHAARARALTVAWFERTL